MAKQRKNKMKNKKRRQKQKKDNASGRLTKRECPSLPPLESRIHKGFLQSVQEYGGAEIWNLLNSNERTGLAATCQKLDQSKPSVKGANYSALEEHVYEVFPPIGLLMVGQYKQRSVKTLVKHMDWLSKMERPPAVVLMGDSMFERMGRKGSNVFKPNWREKLFLFAVGGDGVEHLRCRSAIAHGTYLAEIPEFVLMIGINNIMGATRGNESGSAIAAPEDIAQAIVSFVKCLRDRARTPVPPKIYVCKLLHIWGSDTLDCTAINARVDRVNVTLETLLSCGRLSQCCTLLPTVMPIDRSNYLKDGLHLSEMGYKKLIDQLPDSVRKYGRA